MAKSRTQIAREHVARLRRKAQAFDKLLLSLNIIIDMNGRYEVPTALVSVVEEAQKAVQDGQA